jgi:hypothetical protein
MIDMNRKKIGFVLSSLARQLEQELNEALKRIEELENK